METISYTLPPEQDGATVRHILKAALHVSSHAISRLTRTENGIRVNGIHARTVDILHTGDVLEVETSDHRPPRVRPTPGPWPLPIVWEDGHLLVVNKPAGMTAHASNFLPDTPTVAGALDTYAKALLNDSLTVPGPSPIMRCWGGRTACPSCGCGRRQGGPISSGCTWPPSAAPWQGTGCTGKRTRT